MLKILWGKTRGKIRIYICIYLYLHKEKLKENSFLQLGCDIMGTGIGVTLFAVSLL